METNKGLIEKLRRPKKYPGGGREYVHAHAHAEGQGRTSRSEEDVYGATRSWGSGAKEQIAWETTRAGGYADACVDGFIRVEGSGFPSAKRLGVDIESCWRYIFSIFSKKLVLGECLGNS